MGGKAFFGETNRIHLNSIRFIRFVGFRGPQGAPMASPALPGGFDGFAVWRSARPDLSVTVSDTFRRY